MTVLIMIYFYYTYTRSLQSYTAERVDVHQGQEPENGADQSKRLLRLA